MNPSDEPAAPRAEPIFNIPRAVVLVIVALCLAYLVQWGGGPERELELMEALAVVPARLSIALGWTDLQEVFRAAVAGAGPAESQQRRALIAYFVNGRDANWWSLATHALLHGDLLHLSMNCIWLAIFGSPVARRFGAGGFLLLLIGGAAAGALFHVAANRLDFVPMLGASGAVSAATGAAARFVFSLPFRPGALADDRAVRAMPALGLTEMLRNRQALAFVVIWFASNWLFGSGLAPVPGADQSIAWQAHIGGFLAGMALFPVFDRAGRSPPQGPPP